MKIKKGISLVALVITIVVLIILTGTIVLNIGGDNSIINKAKEARELYRASLVEEKAVEWRMNVKTVRQTGIGTEKTLETQLNELSSQGSLTQEEVTEILNSANKEITIATKTISFLLDGETVEQGQIAIKVGDKVNYNEGTGYTWTANPINGSGGRMTGNYSKQTQRIYQGEPYTTENLTWRVLRINNGQIELISETPTNRLLYIGGQAGYINGVNELNNFCDTLYGKGTGAISARSVTIEDIDRLTGYDPTTNYKYGQTWKCRKYSSVSNKIQVIETGGTWTDTQYTEFIYYNGNQFLTLTEGIEGISLINTLYDYTFTPTEIGDVSASQFWLASQCVECIYPGRANFSMRLVRVVEGEYSISYAFLFCSADLYQVARFENSPCCYNRC